MLARSVHEHPFEGLGKFHDLDTPQPPEHVQGMSIPVASSPMDGYGRMGARELDDPYQKESMYV